MLAKANRVLRPADIRAAIRSGRRSATGNLVVHVLDRRIDDPARFAFVVGRKVGGAVTRNRVKRRLRAASALALPDIRPGHDVVIRALPGSGAADWATLQSEVDRGLRRGGTG